MLLYELDQNRTDIYFRDKEVLYLIKLLILGDKRFELLKAIAIEFTAQPFLPIKELSFFSCSFYPKNDLNVHDITSTKLKFVLSTNSSTRIFTMPKGIP